MTWPMVKLGELVSVKGGKRLPKGAEYSTEVTKHPYIRVCDMGLGELKTPDSDLKYISDEVFDSIKRYTISSEDVYISIAGTIGVVGCIPKRLSGANLTENAAKLVIKDSDKLCKNFLIRFLSSQGKSEIEGKTKSTSQPKLALFRIEELEIPLPPLSEQKRIAAILDKADAIRRKRQQAIQLADDFLRAVFLDMFGDPVTNPKGWEVQRIGSLGKAITGATPPGAEKGMWGDEVPFVTPGDLGDVVVSVNRYLSQKGVEYSRVCRAGSLMVCCIGATIGKVGISSTPSAFNQQINSLEWSSKVNDFYGYYLFKLFPQLIVKNSIKTTLPILKKSLFENILIPVPRIELQEIFESIFNQINKLINRNPSLLNRSLFDALSQKAFRGEL